MPRNTVTTPPRRVPAIGEELHLQPADWRYNTEDRPLRLRVDIVRADISVYYGGDWVWCLGVEVDAFGPARPVQVLVRCDAIPSRSSPGT